MAMIDLAPLSRRTSHLREASILRALTLKVNALDDGINLGQGVCDLEMPRPLRLAAVESLLHDRATYTNFAGVLPLREQIVRRMKERYGLEYDVGEVVVTVGSSMAYTSTLMTLVDPGDEVVLFEPFYPYHHTGARLAGAVVKPVPLTLGDDGIDWLYGGAGDDSLGGGTDNDYLNGGTGNDYLNGGTGTVFVVPAHGFDELLFPSVAP